jgi:hypothetical protein
MIMNLLSDCEDMDEWRWNVKNDQKLARMEGQFGDCKQLE